ncbi:MAG: alpha/beta fold hydrolase, partial [Pseudonocardiaceae bacterium]
MSAIRSRDRAAGPGLVLLHSPLVGPLCWQPLVERLRADGHRMIAPDLRAAATSGDHQQSFVADAVAALRVAGMSRTVLVGHSGAGPLLPAIAAVTATVGVIYVDARLPRPGASWFDTVPPPLAAHLTRLADENGVLPRWSDWFGPEVLTETIPDAPLRARFIEELPPLSLSYF